MAKMSETMRGYEAGLSAAWDIVRTTGVESLEQEIKFRNITGFHTKMPKQDTNNLVQDVKDKIMSHLMILVFAAVHDEFGFGEQRCKRLWDKIEEAAEYLCKDAATWDDYVQAIADQIGLTIELKK